MPGLISSATTCDQSALLRSTTNGAGVASRAASESSQAQTIAPEAPKASAAARPERASPSTATTLSSTSGMRIAAVIASLSQLQGGETDQGQHRGDEPAADDDGGLRPALLLEMMMQRRHHEDALARGLERDHLHHDRDSLQHEETADDRQHQLVLGDDADRAQGTADRE